ncbi:MAG: 1-acyl-sn-glycerol-3-phosphate acyltransferase [Geothrix sp.]|uniref:lysophospholipid acyltransferase family protein n=1 Tax=Geothrix sp. TaxID=1962974 RepID=UPI0018044E55|nr:lysophospholipid acyltransferase family protein [Geothrix sp.]NWJ40530.1 1-acyl-sn-glycerol-3-phosphate acyltransferase [Geothrix sp.]WIL21465.1 MAG: 1-acyl-sn-glycerol-3-phosphate acyltransferase [Geothrix sp.]
MANWRDTGFGAVVMMIWALVTVPLTVLGILLAVPFLGRRRAFFAIGPMFARGMAWFCHIPFTLKGWEHLPEDIREGRQSVIFMSNHESQMDPPILVAALPVPAVYIAKKELKYMPFIGWAGWAAGVIFIDRGDRERAIRSIRDAATQIRGGKNVVIFPEGTRSRSGEMLPFKKGGFALALEAGVPIVPMATVGGFHVLSSGSVRIRPGRYALMVGEPVHPAGYPDRDALMKEVRARIEGLVTEARTSIA